MDLKRAATIVVVGVVLGIWLAAAATSGGRRNAAVADLRVPTVDVRGATLSGEITRLNERLRPTTSPHGNRNLFQFAGARPRSTAVVVAPKPALSEAAAAPAPLPPMIKLVGIAEDEGPNGPVRTAILSDAGKLLFVKEGETATSRYRVVKIAEDVVELADTLAGSTIRLPLR